MADRPFDPETGELIPKAPEREDLLKLCREFQDRGDIYFLEQLFAAQSRNPPTDL